MVSTIFLDMFRFSVNYMERRVRSIVNDCVARSFARHHNTFARYVRGSQGDFIGFRGGYEPRRGQGVASNVSSSSKRACPIRADGGLAVWIGKAKTGVSEKNSNRCRMAVEYVFLSRSIGSEDPHPVVLQLYFVSGIGGVIVAKRSSLPRGLRTHSSILLSRMKRAYSCQPQNTVPGPRLG
jgi:hypothetical protein